LVDYAGEGEMGEACSTYGGMMNVFDILLGKPEGEVPLGVCRGIIFKCALGK